MMRKVLCIFISFISIMQVYAQSLVPFGLNPNGVSHLYWPYDEPGRRDQYLANYGASWCEGEGCQRGIELDNVGNAHWSVSCNAWKSFCPAHLKGDKYAQDWLRQPEPADGHAIYAPMACKVIYTGNASADYGQWILLQSYQQTNLYMFIAHMASIDVGAGAYLSPREKIGIVGKSGKGANDVPHAHIALYRDIDPSKLHDPSRGVWTTPQDEKYAAKFLFDADTRKICMPDGPGGTYSFINGATIPNYTQVEIEVQDDDLRMGRGWPKPGMTEQHVVLKLLERLGVESQIVTHGKSTITIQPADQRTCPNNSYANEPKTENRNQESESENHQVADDVKYSDFTAYPNPVDQVLTITSKGNTMTGLDIINASGVVIASMKLPLLYEISLSLDDFMRDEHGLFYVKVRFYDGNVKFQKIIKH